MDPDNERRIRAGYAAFERGDLDATMEDFAVDTRFVNPEYALESGEREGREGVEDAFQSVHEWMKLESLDVEEVVEGPEGYLVVVRIQGVGRASGIPVDARYVHVLHYRDDRVYRFTWFDTREEGLAAIGLG